MKLAALLLIFLLTLVLASSNTFAITNRVNASSSSGPGGNSTTRVYINNNLNTGNNTSSFTSETKTDVHISQEGEGTSSVNINGKEWKLEGPGEINVNEGLSSTESSPTESLTQTPTSEPKPEVLGDNDEVPSFLGEIFQNLFKSLQQFLSRIFYRD